MPPNIRNDAGLTVDEQCEFVVLLHSEGKTDQQIADYLGIARSGVTVLRNRLELSPRWGAADPPFTPQQDSLIIQLRDDYNKSWAAIAREVRCRDARVVIKRYDEIHEERERLIEAQAVSKGKKCLRCRKPFFTKRPKDEWYCDPCRTASKRYGPSDDGDYNIAI